MTKRRGVVTPPYNCLSIKYPQGGMTTCRRYEIVRFHASKFHTTGSSHPNEKRIMIRRM